MLGDLCTLGKHGGTLPLLHSCTSASGRLLKSAWCIASVYTTWSLEQHEHPIG